MSREQSHSSISTRIARILCSHILPIDTSQRSMTPDIITLSFLATIIAIVISTVSDTQPWPRQADREDGVYVILVCLGCAQIGSITCHLPEASRLSASDDTNLPEISRGIPHWVRVSEDYTTW